MEGALSARRGGAAPLDPDTARHVEPQRPRVLYVINGFQRGGAEQGLVRLVRDGAFAGCDLHVVSIVGGDPSLMEDLRAHGAVVTPVSPNAQMGVFDLARAGMFLASLAGRFRPHATVLSLPQANILGRLVSLLAPMGVVCSFEHNTHLAKGAYEVAYRLLSGRVSVLLADADATAEEAAHRLYRKTPPAAFVLPLVAFEPAPVTVREVAGPLRLVNAARFTEVKNQAALIRAVEILRERNVPVSLTLLGEGPELSRCRALVDSLDLADRVQTPGFRTGWAASGDFDVFVLSSRHEGLCIAMLEAMHAGLATIAPLVGGVRDYGPSGQVSLVSDVEPASLADAIEQFHTDRHAMAAVANAGAQAVRQRYGSDAVRARYGEFAAYLHSMAAGTETDSKG
jgi:glycosyltransferase involved in cell wall biosynthesis